MVKFYSFALFTLVCISTVAGLQNHFGTPCQLCDCFIHYDDRDISLSQSPYKVINDSYSVTEDNCLAGCLKEQECKVAVYGYIGGRTVFTCEYYNQVDFKQPIYAPYTNIYLKRETECMKHFLHYKAVDGIPNDKEVFKRKKVLLKVHERLNPFNFGRR